MQVDGGTKFAKCERRTLNMPTRSTSTPHGVPRRFVRSRWMPQYKVEWIALMRVVNIAATFTRKCDHRLTAVMRDAAKLWKLLDVEVHRATGLIGKTTINHHADEPTNVWNCRRCARSAVHGQRIQSSHVRFKTRLFTRCEVQVMHSKFASFSKQRVVYVCHIAYALHLMTHVN